MNPRLQFFLGKGGTGKSTVALAAALAHRREGRRTLLIELGEPGGIARSVGLTPPEPNEPVEVQPGLSLMWIQGETALVEYLSLILPARRLLQTVFDSSVYRTFVAAAPGLRELMAIGKVWFEVEKRADGDPDSYIPEDGLPDGDEARPLWDAVVVDAGSSGHALQALQMPLVAAETFDTGLVHREAGRVESLLRDPGTTVVHLVATPEEMPLVEAAEAVERLRGDLNMPVGRLIVNRCRVRPPVVLEGLAEASRGGPPDDSLEGYREAARACTQSAAGWYRVQEEEIAAVCSRIGSPVLRLPTVQSDRPGLADIEVLADVFAGYTTGSYAASEDSAQAVQESTGDTAESVSPSGHAPDESAESARSNNSPEAPAPDMPEHSPGNVRLAEFGDGLEPLTREHRVIVCVGSGGVGKTTVSASIALHAAMQGKRVMVLTIDPARRLAQSLGLGTLSSSGQRVDLSALQGSHNDGSLSAGMLDQKSAWDEFIARQAPSEQVRNAILQNSFYRQLSGSFSGSAEYMAVEELCRLHESGDYDLIVLDTPPSAHALDFLEAPRRMQEFLDRSVIGWIAKPYLSAGWAAWKGANRTMRFLFDKIEDATGVRTLGDIAEFFVAMDAVFDGIAERGARVQELLRGDEAAFVLVSAPENTVLEEAGELGRRMEALDIRLRGVVWNRVHPVPACGGSAAAELPVGVLDEEAVHALGETVGPQVAGITAAAFRRESLEFERLRTFAAAISSGIRTVAVQELPADVHDLVSLAEVGCMVCGPLAETRVS